MKEKNVVYPPKDFPKFKKIILEKRLITTDGSTLLGADW